MKKKICSRKFGSQRNPPGKLSLLRTTKMYYVVEILSKKPLIVLFKNMFFEGQKIFPGNGDGDKLLPLLLCVYNLYSCYFEYGGQKTFGGVNFFLLLP